jgi:3-hydroxyisobutyrate dehydrogenase-like beta-hydroxyacid dehydrogenase
MIPSPRIAFIGLGNMGGPMAHNLAQAGFDLTVTDLDTSRVSALVAHGAHPAPDARSAVVGADVVLTSLPGPAQVRAVADEIIPAMSTGAVWADLSTNDLPCAEHIATLARAHDVAVLDAPVTGGAEGAEAGTLNILVGGDAAAHERCRPVFDCIGTRHDLLGRHGAGYVAKISQVMLCYLNSVCLTEALILGVKGGVEPAKMLDIIQHSTGRSYVAERYGPELLNGGYDDTFDLTLAAKDLRLAMQLAGDVGATLHFTADVNDVYAIAESRFGPNAPHLMAMQTIEDDNDLRLHEHMSIDDTERSTE